MLWSQIKKKQKTRLNKTRVNQAAKFGFNCKKSTGFFVATNSLK
jgi:hypothetical protein